MKLDLRLIRDSPECHCNYLFRSLMFRRSHVCRRPRQFGERLASERGELGKRLSAEQQRTPFHHARSHGCHNLPGHCFQRAVRRVWFRGQARAGLGPDRGQRCVHVQRKFPRAISSHRSGTSHALSSANTRLNAFYVFHDPTEHKCNWTIGNLNKKKKKTIKSRNDRAQKYVQRSRCFILRNKLLYYIYIFVHNI